MKKLAFAALIALSLAGVVSTPAMAAPPPCARDPYECEPPPPPPSIQGDPSQWGMTLISRMGPNDVIEPSESSNPK